LSEDPMTKSADTPNARASLVRLSNEGRVSPFQSGRPTMKEPPTCRQAAFTTIPAGRGPV
jgi:hypothetical protein